MLSAVTSCPGVFAAAVLDRAGMVITSDAPTTFRPLVHRAAAEFETMLAHLVREDPAWTSAFLTVEQNYVICRRIDAAIVLVLAKPAVAVRELEQTLDAVLDDVRDELLELIGVQTPAPAPHGYQRLDETIDLDEFDLEELDALEELDRPAPRAARRASSRGDASAASEPANEFGVPDVPDIFGHSSGRYAVVDDLAPLVNLFDSGAHPVVTPEGDDGEGADELSAPDFHADADTFEVAVDLRGLNADAIAAAVAPARRSAQPPSAERPQLAGPVSPRRYATDLDSSAEIRLRQVEVEHQLHDIRELQRRLLPHNSFIDRTGIEIAGYFLAADVCSGDWWAVEPMSGNRTLVMMGDVTGHGAGPAMVTGIAKAAFDVAVAWRGELVTCDDILGAMNAAVYRAARGKMLMTCVASVIDPAQRTVSVTNAGHVFPMLVRRSAGGWQLRELVARGSPLGSAEAADLDTSVIDLAPEDTLVWYTDGLTDCENASRAQFGRKRLARSLRRESSTTPVDIRDRILLDLRQFSGERPPADDITFAVARIKPHGPA